MQKDKIFQALKVSIDKGTSIDEIKKHLFQYALDDIERNEMADSIKNYYYEKQRKAGFKWVGIGSAILIVSFLLTIILFHNDHRVELFMYGSSIIGLGIAFWGCTKIL